MNVLNAANTFLRSSLRSIIHPRNIHTYVYPLHFRTTDILAGEPLKKKRRLDPAIVRAKEERTKKKMVKQIRRLEKHSKQLKPIFEIYVEPELLDQKEDRIRRLPQLSEEETERRALLEKEWTRYKRDQWLKNVRIMKSIILSQEKALKELKAVSKDLYKRAVEFDDSFFPYDARGPLHTPPINNYDSPDGEYVDVTYKYQGETEEIKTTE